MRVTEQLRNFYPWLLLTTVAWVLVYVGTIVLFLWSLFGFLLGIAISQIDFALAEFIRLTLSGWVLFRFYHRPGSKTRIPEKQIRTDLKEFFLLLVSLNLVAITRTIIIETWALFTQSNLLYLSQERYFVYVATSIASFAVIIAHYARSRRFAPIRDFMNLRVENSIRGKAFRKIGRNLENKEREELAQLVFQSYSAKGLSMRDVARFLWLSVFWALVIEILEQLFANL